MVNKIYELLEKVHMDLQATKSELKQDIQSVKNDIIRFENKMDAKISILFDANTAINEKVDDIDVKIDDISRTVTNIELITSKNWNDIALLKKAK